MDSRFLAQLVRCLFALICTFSPAFAGVTPYSIDHVNVTGGTEYRLFHHTHHFMTVIDEDSGAVALRTHPGEDSDGWGSTLYPHPFLPPGDIAHGVVDAVKVIDDGVRIKLSGLVSKGTSDTFGTWTFTLEVVYKPGRKQVIGKGKFDITLDGVVTAQTGDLNLYKIASNYLDDVPLLGGGTGDTGDMTYARVVGRTGQQQDFAFDWVPPVQPAHYPADTTDRLAIDVKGQYNNVDSEAQGHDPIEAAYKPSLKVTLTSRDPGAGLTFGAQYDTNHAQDFWEDNVGITPLIRQGNTRTKFSFKVKLQSEAITGDGP
ncbi:MAG: hypothetical protein IT367_15710 [Candidatus Hydrogenedentes bacterium]|nr:hypothetical protein [Candidatus Hydrogenedentota bacterium]